MEKISDNQTDDNQPLLTELELLKNAINDFTESIATLSSLVANVKNTDKTNIEIEAEKWHFSHNQLIPSKFCEFSSTIFGVSVKF